uniref:Small ribosomal subunit protein uS15 N-terminal domain-containing protein n=1 Tax=Bos indicus x Bos taurus TaxID=30522 RepID=A0A4W2H058_BOBOX
MGCMHTPGKGLSRSVLPYHHSVLTWLELMSDNMREQIYKLAKKGLTPSQIVHQFECCFMHQTWIGDLFHI